MSSSIHQYNRMLSDDPSRKTDSGTSPARCLIGIHFGYKNNYNLRHPRNEVHLHSERERERPGSGAWHQTTRTKKVRMKESANLFRWRFAFMSACTDGKKLQCLYASMSV